jgi:hypothetical protein
VEIGLERDAFLYVSDFMELQDEEDVDEIPAGRNLAEQDTHPHPQLHAAPSVAETPGSAAPLGEPAEAEPLGESALAA